MRKIYILQYMRYSKKGELIMKKKKIKAPLIIIFAVILSGILGRQTIFRFVEAALYEQRQKQYIKDKNEADEFAIGIVKNYCNGEEDKILAVSRGDNNISSFLLPDGLVVEYIDKKDIGTGSFTATKYHERVRFVDYVVKYRIVGDIPHELGDYMTSDDFLTDQEEVYLYQTISISKIENDDWCLRLVFYDSQNQF